MTREKDVTTKIVDRITTLHCGAAFYRADMHIHSFGSSHDVSDRGMTPEAIVQKACEEKLDIIAVTDHNEIGNVEAAIAAAEGKPILVIPGVELSTSDGHLLVYFRDFDKLNRYIAQLDIADRGKPNSRCRGSMIECLNKIDRENGFAILAHVDGPKGLEQVISGFTPHKADIVKHQALLGIELLRATSEISYRPSDPEAERGRIGKERQAALGQGPERFLARVLFSDSHSLDALGRNAERDRRITRMKMDTLSFDGVIHGLIDEDARTRLEDEIPEAVPRILGIEIDGGFLDGVTVQMSSNLNCIIGGRGAGKSTLLEAIRSIAPSVSASSVIDSEAWPLGLNVVWVDEAGEHHTVTRPINGLPENLDDAALGAVVFPIECYGQGETAETSKKAVKDPGALLGYLDQFVDIELLQEQDFSIRDRLLENQTELEKADRSIVQIPAYERAEATAKKAVAAIEKTKAKDVLNLEQRLADEAAVRNEIETTVAQIVAKLQEDNVSDLVDHIKEIKSPKDLKTGKSQLQAIEKLVRDLRKRLKKVGDKNEETAKWLKETTATEISGWKEEEKKIRSEIDKQRKALEDEGHKLDIAFIRKVTKDLAEHRTKLTHLRTVKKQRAEIAKARVELLKERRIVRSSISTKRTAFAVKASKALSGEVGDLQVSVKYDEDAYCPEAQDILISALDWRTVQVPRALSLVKDLTVPKLLDCIKNKDPKPIQDLKESQGQTVFPAREAKRILETLSVPEHVFALQRCDIQDLPKITVTRRLTSDSKERVVSRDFGRLSLGQQQSVLLGLMLSSDSRQPLIIDQPEDNLDGEFIYFTLVKALRRAKERRQIIVVTHNANIAVLGDAEQILALKSLNDAGRVVARGSIDDPDTKSSACAILEGSKEAFRKRAEIYGIGQVEE